MSFHKIALKIAYWLVALSIVVLIGFTFFARHIITSQSQKAPEKQVEKEETTNFKYSGMSLTIDKKPKKETTETQEPVKTDEGGKTGEQ